MGCLQGRGGGKVGNGEMEKRRTPIADDADDATCDQPATYLPVPAYRIRIFYFGGCASKLI